MIETSRRAESGSRSPRGRESQRHALAVGCAGIRRALSHDRGAWQVKSMDDGKVIWASDASDAVVLVAHALEHVGTPSDLLPVHVGDYTGPAGYARRNGPGSAVNIAARLAAGIALNEVFVSAKRAVARGELTRRLASKRELTRRGVERPIAAWCVT